MHVGDRTFDAGATVWTLDVTDDGAVYVTEDSDTDPSSDPVWFSDGSTPVAIGTIPTEHYSRFAVSTADAGSLVVWPDATSDRFVVYDTSRREVVAQIRSDGVVLHVDDSHVYFNPDPARPAAGSSTSRTSTPAPTRSCSATTSRPVRPRRSGDRP